MTIAAAVPHKACETEIRRLREECAAWRLKVRALELDLAAARAEKATANGIAVQVFEAIRSASRSGLRANTVSEGVMAT